MEFAPERFHSYNRYLLNTFGVRTYKIVIASGLTCPTRDGTIASRGCAFCDVRGSSSYFGKIGRGKEVKEQIAARLPAVRERFSAEKFLAYFQSYTNTYSDVEALREMYEAALQSPGISGLCIGTRPDCLPDPVIDLLEELAQSHYLSLELGVQSFEDPTLLWLARGHDAQSSWDALERLSVRAPHVHVCVHLMFGSPTDTSEAPRKAAQLLSNPRFRVKGVKLHQLMILQGTELAKRWTEESFSTLSLEEYAERVVEFLAHLDPSIYVERLFATATHSDECVAPLWSRKRWEPHNFIRDLLESRGVVQGAFALPIPSQLAKGP